MHSLIELTNSVMPNCFFNKSCCVSALLKTTSVNRGS